VWPSSRQTFFFFFLKKISAENLAGVALGKHFSFFLKKNLFTESQSSQTLGKPYSLPSATVIALGKARTWLF
jgi:hypothetical protein